jgi:hypothetical protein
MGLTNDEAEKLQEMLELLGENLGSLRDREREFVNDQIKRWDEHGANMRLSTAQWRWLNDIYNKVAS